MEYYKNLITEKSFKILQNLKRKHDFILIGGWAVFLYTQALKSKDIDMVVNYEELEKLRGEFTLAKNDRLKKYEIVIEEIDIDIYLPFYSDLGIPVEKIQQYMKNLEGFTVPNPEILLILKQKAYRDRAGNPKGEKDKIDILSLLKNVNMDFGFYRKILTEYDLKNYLGELKIILKVTTEAPEIGLNQFQFSKLKKRVLAQLDKK